MFVLGHVGIGRLIVGRRGRALPVVPFLLGAILPDLIDKPLYYAHMWDYITCTRTFGHTGLLLAALALVAYAKRSPSWTAVALAMSTHFVFDGVLDLQSSSTSTTWIAFSWPFVYGRFATFDIPSPLQHLMMIKRLDIIVTETIGAILLWREFSGALTRRRTE
jgi:hypothetical protein